MVELGVETWRSGFSTHAINHNIMLTVLSLSYLFGKLIILGP